MTTQYTKAQIIQIVDPIAQQYGVPTKLWETVADVESGFNNNAVGDNGTSFGLFQLHQGGQLGNLTPAQADDPATNARAAMPAIANAWAQLKDSFNPTNSAWWLMFAVDSGHPGGNIVTPGDAEQSESTRLMNDYNTGKATDNGTTVVQDAGNAVSSATDSVVSSVLSGLLTPFNGGFLKVGVFLFALVLLIIGLFIMAQTEEAGK